MGFEEKVIVTWFFHRFHNEFMNFSLQRSRDSHGIFREFDFISLFFELLESIITGLGKVIPPFVINVAGELLLEVLIEFLEAQFQT